MTSTEYLPVGTWNVWGDSPTPVYVGVAREAAIAEVDRLAAQGRTDVYAKDSNSDETYRPKRQS